MARARPVEARPEAEAARPGTSGGGVVAGEGTDSVAALRELMDELPEELTVPVFTHASWTARRVDSYERLAFLGDSVLALAVSAHLYPALDAERFGAGRLTKIRAQAVSGRSCRVVAERMGIPQRLVEAAPSQATSSAETLITAERVLASVIEAVIGACFVAFGYERTAAAVVQAFGPEIDDALERSLDFKSALQEFLARRGAAVVYDVVEEVGRGRGRSKKDAEQEAAQAALAALEH